MNHGNSSLEERLDAFAPFDITGILYREAILDISTAGLLQSAPVRIKISLRNEDFERQCIEIQNTLNNLV